MSETELTYAEQAEKVKKANLRLVKDLAVIGMRLDPSTVLLARIDALLDGILTTDQRELFEFAFEQKINDMLTEAQKQATRQKLLSNVDNVAPSGLFLPGK